ncbi:MAG: hypothetical protein ACJ8AO_08810 [Gemmatimonadaceae bacterium]
MRRRALCGLALLAAAALGAARPAAAQANTAEMLASAVQLYEDLQVERAVALLRQVISPSSPYEVSREQRVRAYTYLGAALAVLGQRDSAVVYLRAAIERDPFVDMDAESFSPAERAALAEARARTFAVAVRPVAADTVDPRTERLAFSLFTTHEAAVRAEVRAAGAGGAGSAVLLDGANAGLREVAWSGVTADGRLAPPGRYALVVTGRSDHTGLVDSVRVWFDVAHDRPALEDTLPSLGPADLLPERHPTSVATRDFLRGTGVAAAALLAHTLLRDRALGGGGRYAGTVALVGTAAGAWAFVSRQHRRDIPANVAENRRRLADRDRRNAEVARRNAERLAQTRLVVTPAAGAAVDR